MFQYALGLAMSENGLRRLTVDASRLLHDRTRSYQLGGFLHPPKHAGVAVQCGLSVLSRTPFWNIVGSRRLPLFPGGPRLILETSPAFNPRLHAAEGSVVLDGYWQSEDYFCSHVSVIRDAFRWPECKDMPHRRTYEMICGCESSVAVHVRRGDYVSDPKTRAYHGTCPLAYYQKAAAFISQHVNSPRFFVFSDEPHWARDNLRLPGPHEFITNNVADAAHRDIALFSLCKHAIIANSSFSWWGAWLAEWPGKIVVSPKQWYADPAMQHIHPAPARWMRI